jgi:hypothetical protein
MADGEGLATKRLINAVTVDVDFQVSSYATQSGMWWQCGSQGFGYCQKDRGMFFNSRINTVPVSNRIFFLEVSTDSAGEAGSDGSSVTVL